MMGFKRTVNEICERCGKRDARLEVHEQTGIEIAYVIIGLHTCGDARQAGPHTPPRRFRLDDVIWKQSGRHAEFCAADVIEFSRAADEAFRDYLRCEEEGRRKRDLAFLKMNRLGTAVAALKRSQSST